VTVTTPHEVLIVLEGAVRLAWRRSGAARWSPVGLWPTDWQAADLLDHVRRGLPLLVVLEQVSVTVPMLAEEFADAPPAVAALAEQSGEVVEVRIPTLDWLPADLRDRGLDFVRDSAAYVAGTPRPLRPALLLEEPATPRNVRFARVLDPGRYRREELAAVARYAFATHHVSMVPAGAGSRDRDGQLAGLRPSRRART
jgi:hypothetical protein